MEKTIYFNGIYHNETDKLLSVQDRGVCFGDGLFEVIRCINGKFLLFTKHMNRMKESAFALEIPFSFQIDALLDAARKLSAKNNIIDGELYVELTRGEAPRYHPFPKGINPNFFMILNPLRKMPEGCRENGVKVCLYPDLRGFLCQHKTINLLANVLGKEDAKRKNMYEACFYREDEKSKYITEGASSSFFALQDDILYTPSLENILPGATRAAVISLAKKESIEVKETRVYLDDYLNSDEAFLVSTVSQVMPLIGIEEKIIANGKPGKITKKLQLLYNNFMNQHME